MLKLITVTVAIVVIGLLAIQLVPYGREHTNPPVTGEPAWDSPTTRQLAKTACFDCHSNETQWPWYASVAPLSWLTQRHVDEGRDKLNFSEWGSREQEIDEIVASVKDGDMPPGDYLILHREARLSDADRQTLIDGLSKTFGAGGSGGDGEDGEGGDD